MHLILCLKDACVFERETSLTEHMQTQAYPWPCRVWAASIYLPKSKQLIVRTNTQPSYTGWLYVCWWEHLSYYGWYAPHLDTPFLIDNMKKMPQTSFFITRRFHRWCPRREFTTSMTTEFGDELTSWVSLLSPPLRFVLGKPFQFFAGFVYFCHTFFYHCSRGRQPL